MNGIKAEFCKSITRCCGSSIISCPSNCCTAGCGDNWTRRIFISHTYIFSDGQLIESAYRAFLTSLQSGFILILA